MQGAADVLHRLRFLVFALFAANILAALFYNPTPEPLRLALAVLGGFAVALACVRQWRLALAAALAPLPGVLWFGTATYALILAFSVLTAATFSDAVLKGGDGVLALRRFLPALGGALLFALLWSLHTPVQLLALLAASVVTAFCLPALLLCVYICEDAIIRGNRQREALLRLFGFVARIAEPRWSLSISGVGLVLAVLGYFQMARHVPSFNWLCGLAIGAIALVLLRDARDALAALAAAALLLLFTVDVGGAQLLFLLFVLALGGVAADWRGQGDSQSLAWIRTIEDYGAAVLFAGLAAMIAAALRGGPPAALHAFFGLAAALILFPAFAGTLHYLFPPRRRAEDIYRANAS